jgi:hypothetical protein
VLVEYCRRWLAIAAILTPNSPSNAQAIGHGDSGAYQIARARRGRSARNAAECPDIPFLGWIVNRTIEDRAR